MVLAGHANKHELLFSINKQKRSKMYSGMKFQQQPKNPWQADSPEQKKNN